MPDAWTAIVGAVLGIGSALAGAIGASIRATWKMAEIKEAAVKESITHAERISASDNTSLRSDLRIDQEEAMKQFGEALSAVRQKITETELWNRDNFVRRTDFAAVVESMNRSMDALGNRMEAAFVKLESKIDKLAEQR